MESPVVVDKPPEYCGNNCNEHGFPFDEESRSSAWSDLAARHPDIAARLRARPHNTWGRKRRPGSQDAAHEFGGGFDSFPFDDIPPEFREHFPSHWGRRFNPDEESSPQQTTSTQTEVPPEAQPPQPSQSSQPSHLPQYGLRNTVDLGQKSPADPSLVDEQDRSQRSASAPPEANNTPSDMSHSQQHPDPPEGHPTHSNVRHIPIFVEGRDEPVCNKQNHAEPKRAYTPPNQDREQQYFAEEPSFPHPPNFSRPFGTFGKGFRQNAQPFTQQKVYPQSAFAREGSPHRSQSPRPQPKETFVKVPVHAEPKPHPQAKPQAQQPQPPQQPKPQPPPQHKPQPQQQPPPPPPAKEQSPEPSRPTSNDPITVILAIQTDVLNLMTEVEKFTGTKADKRYMYLDEMLTRNLIKLDNVETDGKENIRQARKEAIKCIQKCIAVLEAKADGRSARPNQDVDINSVDAKHNGENGEAEVKETKEENTTAEAEIVADANQTEAHQTDTRPEAEDKPADVPPETVATENVKKTPKKVKKSDKSKDKEEVQKEEVMQVDKPETNQSMEVDGATASQ